MQVTTPKSPEQYATSAKNLVGADYEISRRHFESTLRFLAEGEPHNRNRGVKHPIMIAVYLSEDFIHMLDKFTDRAKASGQLNPYAKRQDFVRKATAELMLKTLEESMESQH